MDMLHWSMPSMRDRAWTRPAVMGGKGGSCCRTRWHRAKGVRSLWRRQASRRRLVSERQAQRVFHMQDERTGVDPCGGGRADSADNHVTFSFG